MSNLDFAEGGQSWLTISPEQFRAAARTLAATAETNETTLNALASTASELTADTGGWSGRASRHFTATWTRRAEQLRGQIRTHRDAATILDKFAADLQAAQQAYGWTGQRAAALGATLTPEGQVVTGGVVADTLLGPPPGLKQEVTALEREAAAVHSQIADADRRATTLLLALADRDMPRPEFSEGLPALLQAGINGSIQNTAATQGIEPALAAAWFASLSPTVRERLIRTAPNLIGSLDGLPPAARDQANRLRIRHELAAGRADLAARRRELAAGPPAGQAAALRQHIEELEQHWSVRERTLNNLLAGDHQILSFDNRGEGRAVVATGDITRASHVAVVVAGMGTTIDNLDGTIGNGKRLRDEIEARFGPAVAQDTAVVTWFDYDAPDDLKEAWSPRFAERGAPSLSQFTDGLQAVHDGDPHMTVVAHSYGSSTTGMAASEHGLQPVDDMVFIGSPGVIVDNTDQLNLGEDARIWAALNGNDQITLAGPTDFLDEQILGPMPTRPEFGAQAFTANADGGHSDYFDENTESIHNLARIVANRPEEVQ